METYTYNNDYFIVRGTSAGVYLAQIEHEDGEVLRLKNARLLHYFNGATGTPGLARDGVQRDGNRFTAVIPSITIRGWCAIIPVSDQALARLQAVPDWKA